MPAARRRCSRCGEPVRAWSQPPQGPVPSHTDALVTSAAAGCASPQQQYPRPHQALGPHRPPGAGKPLMDSSPLYRPFCPHRAAWPLPCRLTPRADRSPRAASGRRAASPGPVTVQGQALHHRHMSRVQHRVLPRQRHHPRRAHGAGVHSPAHTPAAPTLQPPAPLPAARTCERTVRTRCDPPTPRSTASPACSVLSVNTPRSNHSSATVHPPHTHPQLHAHLQHPAPPPPAPAS